MSELSASDLQIMDRLWRGQAMFADPAATKLEGRERRLAVRRLQFIGVVTVQATDERGAPFGKRGRGLYTRPFLKKPALTERGRHLLWVNTQNA